uniref:Lipase maturation factor n=1 Tax=Canis lupus familiaris TaxID=9615 RepID=A0A8C0RKT1_CANLF
ARWARTWWAGGRADAGGPGELRQRGRWPGSPAAAGPRGGGGVRAPAGALGGSLTRPPAGLYGAEGILPARRTLRPQGKGRWRQLWETPTLLWEAPQLGLDTAQGLELLSLLGALLALGALLLRPLRNLFVYLLLWAAYLSACQVSGAACCHPHPCQDLSPRSTLAPACLCRHPLLPDSLSPCRWARCFFTSSALTYHYETQCLPTPASWFAHHLPIWLHKLSVVATFLIEIAVPPLFFAPVHRLRLAAFYSQVLLQVLIIITGNYNFFNLLTLVLTTALLDDGNFTAEADSGRCRKTPASWPRSLLALLALLLECTIYGLLAYGTVRYFGLEVDWEQLAVHSTTTFTFHQFSQWLKMVILPTMWLGVASLGWELLTAFWRWTQVRGWLRKFCTAVQLFIFGTATVALFVISLVPYSYIEPSTHGRLWTGAHRLFGTVEHLQLANSYGLFRRMTGLGGRPEVVLEGSYDGQHWKEIEFMYKPGNLSRPPPIVAPHQPRLDWQMWFAALGPHSHSPWFTSLVLRLLQGREPVIRLIQNDVEKYPFHKQPPTYVRAQRYKYWFSHPGEQSQWWRRQWVEEFFPPVSLGDPLLDALLRQFGLQDKSPPRARSSGNTLAQALHWIRKQLSPLEASTLLWGLLAAVGAIRGMQALLGPRPPHASPVAKEEKHRPAPKKDCGPASKAAAPAPDNCSGSAQAPRRKK